MYHRKGVADSNAEDPEDYWEENGTWYYRANSGHGFDLGQTQTWMPEQDTSVSSGTYNNQYAYAYDYNKDGIEDLIASGKVYIARHTGNGVVFVEANGNPSIGAVLPYNAPFYSERSANPFLGDFNNDGLVDSFISGTQVHYAKRGEPDLLKTITDGFGAETRFQYSELGDQATIVEDNNTTTMHDLYTPDQANYPDVPGSRAKNVVTRYSQSDGQGGFNHVTYQYEGYKAHARGRGNLGFAKIIATSSATGVVSMQEFSQTYPYIGRVLRSRTEDANGNLISVSDTSYATHSSNPEFVYPHISVTKDYKLTTTSESDPLSVVKSVNTFDAYGTLTDKVTQVGSGYSGSGTSITVNGILKTVTLANADISHHTSSDWLLGFVGETTVTTTDGTDTHTVVTEYDQAMISGTSTPTKDVAETRRFVGTAVWNTETITRNNKGIVTASSYQAADINSGQSAVRSESVTYAAGEYLYPSSATNALNHLTDFIDYDERFGLVRVLEDANGLSTTYTYDSLGRTTATQGEDGVLSRVKQYYCDGATPVTCPQDAQYFVATEVTHSSATGKLGAPLTVEFFDALGRNIRSQTWRFDGTIVKVDTEYDSVGRLDRVSEPYTGSSPSYWTTYSNYDVLGRANTVTGPDGGSVTTTYSTYGELYQSVSTTTVISPIGTTYQDKETLTDALGQVTQVTDNIGTTVDYSYWPSGELKSTTVDNNADTRIDIVYDVAGNKTSMTDPDVGQLSFQYNGFGETRKQTWGSGTNAKFITWQYDVLGRQISRVDTATNGSTTSYSWTWDKDGGTVSTKLIGALASKQGNGFTEEYHYDSLGRLSSAATTITGLGTRTFGYTYDVFGRSDTVTYPGGYAVQNVYHSIGESVRTRQTSDNKILWALGDDLDSRGQSISSLYGNGVVSRYSYNQANGLVSNIISGRLSANNSYTSLNGDIQNLSYSFDTLGNLYMRQSVRETNGGTAYENLQEHFTYDGLNRVQTSTTTGLLGGTRVQSFGYDDLGNLTSKTDVGTLSYAQSGNAGVHAVTAANGKNYLYDVYGNIKQRGTETLDYDVFNKPTRIGNAYFSYGPDHARFKQVEGSKTTYYIGGGAYEEVVESGTTIKKSMIGGFAVHTDNNGNTMLNWLHHDHLGSVDEITDEFGELVDSLSFDPWGKRRLEDWESGIPILPSLDDITTRGFTGHEHLETSELIHMNGRVYDPVIGRFLSPDLLIQAPFNTQSYNRYSYVFNNPLSYTDPNGYEGEAVGYQGAFAEALVEEWNKRVAAAGGSINIDGQLWGAASINYDVFDRFLSSGGGQLMNSGMLFAGIEGFKDFSGVLAADYADNWKPGGGN